MSVPTDRTLVCKGAVLEGDVKVAAGTVVHPRARILAKAGPIRIGRGNIVEELAVICNESSEVMTIGDYNVFEVGCEVYSHSVGNSTVVESRALLAPGSIVGNDCTIGTKTKLTHAEVLSDGMAVFGLHNRHHQSGGHAKGHSTLASHKGQLILLQNNLPKYHRML